MLRTWITAFCVAVVGISGAAAQEAAEHQHEQHSHYAGRESSEIPSLTDQQIEQLRNGDGMGLALPAELNHYPGPKHVLELAGELELTVEQRARTEEIFAVMQERAQALGAEIIDAERHLNQRFRHEHIDETSLRDETGKIAALEGELRFVHLRAHLHMVELLSEEQIARYDQLRGYQQD